MADKPAFPWKREIFGVLVLAAAVFSLLSLYIQGTGIVGHYIRIAVEFLFGRTGPVFVVVAMYGALRVIRGTHRKISPLRAAGVALVVLTGVTLFHTLAVYRGYQLPPALGEELAMVQYGQGSGVLGAILMTALLTAFGLPGSYVIMAAALAIGLILWFHVSLIQLLKLLVGGVTQRLRALGSSLRNRLRQRIQDMKNRRQEAKRLRQEAKRQRREEQRLAKQRRKSAATKRPKQPASPVSEPDQAAAAAAMTKGPSSQRSDPSFRIAKGGSESSSNDERASVPSPEPKAKIKVPKVRGEGFHLPPLNLLNKGKPQKSADANDDQSRLLEDTCRSFGIEASVVNVSRGPVVTRYELQPARGIKVSKITGLADDIALALAASDVRIEAPVPGKSVVGIEIPNRETQAVFFRDVLESEAFTEQDSKVALALGKDIAGQAVVADLKRWLHLLVAGSTGSGKSVCLNSIIGSLLYKATPDEVKLLMIDPKRVELAVYDGVPHLLAPVVTDPKRAAVALRWAVGEMERRYKLFEKTGVRNIDMYQEWLKSPKAAQIKEQGENVDSLPYIVIIVDELADLMMVAASEVEDAICRLAQMARAAGMYLIIATQRPSVDVITGLIKANVPSRIAFAVSSQVDSRTILDMGGAERLIGKGDMLYYPMGASKPTRAQGAWISDREIEALVEFWKQQGEPAYEENVEEPSAVDESSHDSTEDELLPDAIRLVVDTGQASISMLQRRFRIGYSRAARLIDMMEVRGIVGSYQGSKPREVLVDSSDLEGTDHE